MTQKSPQTIDEDMPPIPQFNFAKGKIDIIPNEGEQESSVDSEVRYGDVETPIPIEASRNPRPKTKNKKTSNRRSFDRDQRTHKAAGGNALEESDVIFQPDVVFSTEVRRSIQLDLALLSHKREMSGHKAFTIKQFIHDAMTAWFDSSCLSEKEQANQILQMQFPENDTYDSLNNRIKQDLKRQLKTLKHEREMSNHPINTIIAFTEQALVAWLLLQKDFSVEDRKKHLSDVAA